MAQISTRRVTFSSIVGSAAFRAGIEDYQAGRAPDFDKYAGSKNRWSYERGRQYAAYCAGEGRAPKSLRFGRRVSQIAIRDFAAAYSDGVL